MDTLLDALQEGRLFELPESDKTHALQFLGSYYRSFSRNAGWDRCSWAGVKTGRNSQHWPWSGLGLSSCQGPV